MSEEAMLSDVKGLSLTGDEGFALANLCKRIQFSTLRDMATSEEETYRMLNAVDRLRQALAESGWAVR